VPTSGGTFVCNGATPVTVANANLTANSIILVTLKTVGGTVGAIPVPQTVTPGTGFTIAGTASDTSPTTTRSSADRGRDKGESMFTRTRLTIAALAIGALALAAPALTQSISVPQVTGINAADLFQVIPNGQPSAQSQYAPATLLGNYSQTLPGNNPENALIGGDATTNLWQRATTGSSVTTTITYGGPDRWAYWSGTSTAMTVSRSSTAAICRRPTSTASRWPAPRARPASCRCA
jgi:hypothetical protein